MPVLATVNKRITAKEAYELYQTSYERKQVEQLQKTYSAIRDVATYQTHLISVIDGFDLADYVFNQLKRDDYLVKMEAVSSKCDDHRYRLTVSWAGEAQLNPNKQYVLPMEGTDTEMGYKFYAFKVEGQWRTGLALTDDSAADYGFIVTAKDLRDAPAWVRAIEPVEVEE